MTGAAPRSAAPPAPRDERESARARLASALAGEPISDGDEGRLADVKRRFSLEPAEADILSTLWLCAHDPEIYAQVAALNPVQGQVTVLTILGLFGHERRPRLASGSALLAWRMVSEHPLVSGGTALTIDPLILAWLDGERELDRALIGSSELLPLGPELGEWPIDATAARISGQLQQGGRVKVGIEGDDPVARRWFAAALGMRLGLPVLALSDGVAAGAGGGGVGVDLIVRLHRQAFLDNCIPLLPVDAGAAALPPGVPPFPIEFVQGPAILPPAADTLILAVDLPNPGADARARLWRRLVPGAAGWDATALETLALCHDAGAGDIAAVAARQPESAEVASDMLRERLRASAGPLTRRIDAAFGWDDLVLAAPIRARLEEFAFEARERARLWSDAEAARLFPYGRGLVGLFAGPPGTGKTMAAHIIAGELGLDLLAVDLSAMISKWVGETAQNIQALLSSPVAQRSMLFFDEADAMFAKRVEDMRDAHDRFANTDSSHLMTAIESYPGIVVLATNLKGNIDTAFLRRIRHVVDFPRPDAQAREAIWAKAIVALFPLAQARALIPDLPRLARIEASGALIKNAALSAVFNARRTGEAPTIRRLAEMVARELGKDGAGVSARDIDAVLGMAP